MNEFFSNPLNTFFIGLGVAVVVAVYVWFKGALRQRGLRRELKALQEQLHRQMTILDRGNQKTLTELEELKKNNENLRITVATLKSKPGRAELELLQVYEQALHLMQKRAPGFAPAWEDALAEARREAEQASTGILALVRKAFRPALPGSGSRTAIDAGPSSGMDEAQDGDHRKDTPGA